MIFATTLYKVLFETIGVFMDFFEKIMVNVGSGIIGSGITLFFTEKLNLINIVLIFGAFIMILGIYFVSLKRNKKEIFK